ncbi:hypothetical protein BO443_10238 [Burkholderia orbicola]
MGAAVDPVDAQAYPSAGGWDRGARLGAQGQGRPATGTRFGCTQLIRCAAAAVNRGR